MADEKGLGGRHKMSAAEARQYVNRPDRTGRGPKKWLDPKSRERILYERRFGKVMPDELVGADGVKHGKQGRKSQDKWDRAW